MGELWGDYAREYSWERWFAWFPVRVICSSHFWPPYRWLCYVERTSTDCYLGACGWEYRTILKTKEPKAKEWYNNG